MKLDHFKSIDESELPTEGLVVLFGVNGSGKSNAMEGIEVLLSQFREDDESFLSRIRVDRGQIKEENFASGGMVIDFPDCETPDHFDNELVRSGLRQTYFSTLQRAPDCGAFTDPTKRT